MILSGTSRLLPVDNDPQANLTGACDIPNAGGRFFAKVVSDASPAQATRRRQDAAAKELLQRQIDATDRQIDRLGY